MDEKATVAALEMNAEALNHLLALQATLMDRAARLIGTAKANDLERANFTLSLYADDERTQLVGEERCHAKPLLYDITHEASIDLSDFLWRAMSDFLNFRGMRVIILERTKEGKGVKGALLSAEPCIHEPALCLHPTHEAALRESMRRAKEITGSGDDRAGDGEARE